MSVNLWGARTLRDQGSLAPLQTPIALGDALCGTEAGSASTMIGSSDPFEVTGGVHGLSRTGGGWPV
jgi:hypothetical protein